MTKPSTRSPKVSAKATAHPQPDPVASATTPPRCGSRAEALIALLKRPDGATIEQLTKESGWMPHSVRGFLAGALKKRYGLAATSERSDNVRIYRLSGTAQ